MDPFTPDGIVYRIGPPRAPMARKALDALIYGLKDPIFTNATVWQADHMGEPQGTDPILTCDPHVTGSIFTAFLHRLARDLIYYWSPPVYVQDYFHRTRPGSPIASAMAPHAATMIARTQADDMHARDAQLVAATAVYHEPRLSQVSDAVDRAERILSELHPVKHVNGHTVRKDYRAHYERRLFLLFQGVYTAEQQAKEAMAE